MIPVPADGPENSVRERPRAHDGRDRLLPRRGHAPARPELPQERRTALRAEAPDAVEHRREGGLPPPAPVEADRDPVRLVAGTLEQQRLRRAGRQDDRPPRRREEDALEGALAPLAAARLREADDGRV